MLNHKGIAIIAAGDIITDMKEKMMDANYNIHKAVITVDLENRKIIVEVMRKDLIGIEYKYTISSEIQRPAKLLAINKFEDV